MSMLEIPAALAFLAAAGFAIGRTARPPTARSGIWIVPALLSAALGVFTVMTVAREGLMPVWINHTHNLWGNQVWFDLLLAFALTWIYLIAEARRLGMARWRWLAFFLLTGCVGLFAMHARILYLRERANDTPQA